MSHVLTMLKSDSLVFEKCFQAETMPDGIEKKTCIQRVKYGTFIKCKGIIKANFSDSFTILGLWVLELTVSHINEFNCNFMSPEHYF